MQSPLRKYETDQLAEAQQICGELKGGQDDVGSIAEAEGMYSTAQAKLSATIKEHTAAREEIERVQREIVPGALPAELASYAGRLAAARLAEREIEGRILLGRAEVRGAETTLRRRAQALVRASEAVARHEKAERAAEKREERLEAKRAGLEQSTVRADAAATLAGPTATQARARLEADLSVHLIELAAQRWRGQRATEQHAQVQADTALGLLDGRGLTPSSRADRLTRSRRVLEEKEASLEMLAGLQGRLEIATRALEAVVKSPPLSAPNKKRITDSSVATKGRAASTKELARREALQVWRAQLHAQRLLMLQIELQLQGPTEDQEEELATIETSVAALETSAVEQDAAFNSNDRKALEAWEASVPDAAWRDLLTYLNATAELESIANSLSPGETEDEIVVAEEELVAARQTADKDNMEATEALDVLEEVRLAHEFRAEQAMASEFAALRGAEREVVLS